MSKTAFILTRLIPLPLPFDGDSALSVIVAARKTKAEIQQLYRGFLQQGKIMGMKAINLDYYSLMIDGGNAQPPLILATAKKRREIMEEAREDLRKLMPYARINVVQLRNVADLQHLAEGNNGEIH